MNKKQEVYIGLNSQFSKTTGFSNTYIFQGTREMNANELADKLNNSNTNGNLCDEAATMLRQQQAEIEALNKVIALITEQHDRLSKMLETSLTLNKELNTQLAGWDIEASLKKDYK